jgi:hypothetical protein
MSLSRDSSGGVALTVLNVDGSAGDKVLADLLKHPAILSARELRM